MVLGDPVPWFSAPVLTGGSFDLHVSAGRWVVLSFLGAPGNPRALAEIEELARASAAFNEDHAIIGCVFTGQPDDLATFSAMSSNKLFFLRDDDGAISRMFGAAEMPRTVRPGRPFTVLSSSVMSGALAATSISPRAIRSLPSTGSHIESVFPGPLPEPKSDTASVITNTAASPPAST